MSILHSYAEKIRKSHLVSFDIFDTLLGRTVASPSDVFRMMQGEMSELLGIPLENFYKLRMTAEKSAKTAARKNHDVEDITLQDIYWELLSVLELPSKDLQAACDIEMAWERRCLIPRPAGHELFKLAREFHKDIVLVSDMYLPKSFIEEVLQENGYRGWVKFYLSAELGKTKATGSIFEEVVKDFGTEYENILHIGDNRNGDDAMPRKLGIQTILLPRTVDQMRDRFSFGAEIYDKFVFSDRTLSTSITAQTIADQIFVGQIPLKSGALKEDPFNFGYNLIGPLMAGFSTWLHQRARLAGIDKLIFLSRDGLIMQKAYCAMFGDKATENVYCLASRRIARLCSIYSPWDIRQLSDDPIYSTELSTFLDFRFGLRIDQIDREKMRMLGFNSPQQFIGSKTDRAILSELVEHHTRDILDNARAQRENYSSYLKQYINGGEKVAVVDIGYAGTMQAALRTLLKMDIGGFYLATNAKVLNPALGLGHVEAYIENHAGTRSPSLQLGINRHRFIYETLICSEENSFEGFDTTSTPASPVFWSHSDNINRRQFVTLAHSGAIRFCKEILHRWHLPLETFFLDGKIASTPLDAFLAKPPLKDTAVLEDVEFEDKFGPRTKQVILASPRQQHREKVKELWSEGKKVTLQLKPNLPSPIPPARKSKLLFRTLSEISRISVTVEQRLVTRFLQPNKVRKYNRNRERFFFDSSNKLVRRYGEVTSAFISRRTA